MPTHGSVCRLCVCFTCVALAWNVGISASPAQSKSIHGVNLCQSGLTNNFATFILARLLGTGHHPTAPKSLKSPSDRSYLRINSNSKHAFLLPRCRRCFNSNYVSQRNASSVRRAVMCQWYRLRGVRLSVPSNRKMGCALMYEQGFLKCRRADA